MTAKKKRGTIIVAVGRRPSKQEYAVAEVLARNGFNIEFLPENRSEGLKSADILMGSVVWEIKSPVGNSKKTLDYNIRRALHQSKSIILDLRNYQGDDQRAIHDFESKPLSTKGVERLKVISKDGEIFDIKR